MFDSTKPFLPHFIGKEVDEEAFLERFQSSFIGGVSNQKPVT